MDPTGVELIPVIAIVLFAVAFLGALFVVRHVKSLAPLQETELRPVMPTQPDLEELDEPRVQSARALPPPPPTRSSSIVPASVAPPPTIRTSTPEVEVDDDPLVCCACNQRDVDELIEYEDWQQVESVWGRVLAFFGQRTSITPGRALYARRRWCRSCAAIADHKNRLFHDALASECDARRRIWERRGLVDAVKREIAIAERQYDEQLDELKRNETRARAREIL